MTIHSNSSWNIKPWTSIVKQKSNPSYWNSISVLVITQQSQSNHSTMSSLTVEQERNPHYQETVFSLYERSPRLPKMGQHFKMLSLIWSHKLVWPPKRCYYIFFFSAGKDGVSAVVYSVQKTINSKSEPTYTILKRKLKTMHKNFYLFNLNAHQSNQNIKNHKYPKHMLISAINQIETSEGPRETPYYYKHLIKSAIDIISKLCSAANFRSQGKRAIEPSRASTISDSIPTGGNPAMTAKSKAASVCPALFRTPPSLYLRGKMWPGLRKSTGFESGEESARIVAARSEAETPVVTPTFASWWITISKADI